MKQNIQHEVRQNESAHMLEVAFTILDSDSDELLNKGEFLIAARQLGVFKGSDANWPKFYKALRKEHGIPADGMDLSTFENLLSGLAHGDQIERLLQAVHDTARHSEGRLADQDSEM